MQNQNMNLVLSTDAKPRLKWTPELHQRFVDAVNQLGGPAKATPKSLMRVIGIPGLTLYHLKSHLQKYRLAKNQHSNTTCNDYIQEVTLDADQGIQRSGKQELSQEVDHGSKNEPINENSGIVEALQMQMEVQRKLHEQIEVQRHLQLRIEAQGKYLQSVLNKAKETLSNYSSSFAGIEIAKAELSQLVSMVNSGYPSSSISELTETGDSSLRVTETNRTNGTVCSMDSSLTSEDTQRKNETVRNSRPIAAFLELPSADIQTGEATKDCDSKQKKKNSNAGSTHPAEDQPLIKRSKRAGLTIGFDLNRQYQNEMESGSRVIDLNSVDKS